MCALGDRRVRLGVSSCLIGHEVRFDGGHRRDRFVADDLAERFELVPSCPEMGLGLGAPRESLRLIRLGDRSRLVAPRSGTDHTEAMERWARGALARLRELDISGYVLKSRSPSCGMERVREHHGNGQVTKTGIGVFARALREEMPLLPVEEEGRLHDPRLRENFLERVYAYRRVHDLFAGAWRTRDLVAFHTREKYLVLAHSPDAYRSLGRLVARASSLPRETVAREYAAGFLGALATIATPGRHANVLQHILGFFRRRLGADERRRLLSAIEDYRRSFVPLVVPVTMLRHYAELLGEPYVTAQTYLSPHPKELRLRTYV